MLQSVQLCNTPECAIQASALPEELYHKLNDMETATVGPAMVYRPRSTIAQALSILRKGGINIRVREAEADARVQSPAAAPGRAPVAPDSPPSFPRSEMTPPRFLPDTQAAKR